MPSGKDNGGAELGFIERLAAKLPDEDDAADKGRRDNLRDGERETAFP